MAQQIPQALNDGETEAEPTAALARRIIDLMVLLENGLKLAIWNADPGIPDLDAQHSVAPTAAEQHLAALGVFQRVGNKIAEHLLEQARITVDREAARDRPQVEPPCLRVSS